MGKRHFNEEWLDKPDANGQAISLWCIKKDNFTATCKLCNTHINIAHMGYSALKQHSEKKKHKGFSSTLQKVKDKEKVEEVDKPKCTHSPKCYKTFFVKSSTSTSKASVETSDFAQDIGPSTSQTTVTEVVWTLPQLVAKVEIIPTLQYGSQNIPYSCADALQECYKETVSRLSNRKACFTWIKKDVIYGGIWPRPILPTGKK